MIDIRLLRENPEIVKDSQRRRGENLQNIDKILQSDKEWRQLVQERDALKHKKNEVGKEISQLKKTLKPATEKIKEMGKLSKKIESLELDIQKKIESRDSLLSVIPNILHNSVPSGKDESENTEIKKYGDRPKFKFTPKDHIDLGIPLNLFDIERAAKTSGARFYFLKNEGALLELALAQYATHFLKKKGFSPVIPPHLVREKVMYGIGMLPTSKDEIYKVENEDLYMILTSEHAIGGLHMDEVLDASELPKRYAGISPCYRTEAGSHGRDTKGIFRVHQFEKVEMFSFTKPENSWKEHEYLLECAEKLMQGLEIPYRVMNICTGDIGKTASKKYDIDAWLPGQNAYREIISCSNCTDYQARRLNCRYRISPADKPVPVHTLNSTALALSRTIVAILENNQQEDGSIKIPKVLHKWAGFKEIKSRKK